MSMDRALDDTTLLILYLDRESVLVELYMVFGVDIVKKLVDKFGGSILEVPSRDEMQLAIRDVRIYRALRMRDSNYPVPLDDRVDKLAGEFGLSPSRVRTIACEVHNRLENLDTERKEWVTRMKRELPAGGIS